jgi:hypothetical protein
MSLRSGWKVYRGGPRRPKLPIALIHPLGPIFRHLPLWLRRHLLYLHAYWRWGNFTTPQRFSEKMQWRILYDRRSLLAWTCDKLASKEYVQKTAIAAGINIRIPKTFWFGQDLQELKDAARTFPDRWVLKPNHSCGRLLIVEQSAGTIDWDELAKCVNSWVERDEEELVLGHWAYGQARHCLIAEEYVSHSSATLSDFKLLCFGGRVHSIICSVDSHQLGEISIVFDRTFQLHTKQQVSTDDERRIAALQLSTSDQSRLISIAELLIAPFDQMRVDLYVSDGDIWFGEFSTYHSSGLRSPSGRRMTKELDIERGERWRIPDLTRPDLREAEWRSYLS